MEKEIPTINPKDYPEESELFERIKNICMDGRYTNGKNPRKVSKTILPYEDKDGYTIHEGKIRGLMYFIEPDKQMSAMGDEFRYTITVDNDESCFIDGVLIGFLPDNIFPKGRKVESSGLAKIIKEINPNSKII